MISTSSLGRRSIAPAKPNFTVNYDGKMTKFNQAPNEEDGFSSESESEFSDSSVPKKEEVITPPQEEPEPLLPLKKEEPPIEEEAPPSVTPEIQRSPEQRVKKIKYAHTPRGKELKKKFIDLCESFKGHPKFKMPPEKIVYETALEYYEEMMREADRLNSELETKFGLLQRNNEKFEIRIPERSLTYSERVAIHEEYVTNIVAHYNADNYQYILWIVMVGIELIGVKYFKLPINGYAEMQIQSMQRYRKFLVEMGRVEGAQETTPTHPLIKIALLGGLQLLVLLFVNWASSQANLNNPKLSKVMINMITEVGDYFTGEKTLSATRDSNGLSNVPTNNGGIGDMIKNMGGMVVDAFMNGNTQKEEDIEVSTKRTSGKRGIPDSF